MTVATPRPRIAGYCPACGGDGTLFLATGDVTTEAGLVTCARLDCPNPTFVADLLDERPERMTIGRYPHPDEPAVSDLLWSNHEQPVDLGDDGSDDA